MLQLLISGLLHEWNLAAAQGPPNRTLTTAISNPRKANKPDPTRDRFLTKATPWLGRSVFQHGLVGKNIYDCLADL